VLNELRVGLLLKLSCMAGYVSTAVLPAGWFDVTVKATVPSGFVQPYADSGPQLHGPDPQFEFAPQFH
jgi:hypothetical protein